MDRDNLPTFLILPMIYLTKQMTGLKSNIIFEVPTRLHRDFVVLYLRVHQQKKVVKNYLFRKFVKCCEGVPRKRVEGDSDTQKRGPALETPVMQDKMKQILNDTTQVVETRSIYKYLDLDLSESFESNQVK